MLLIHRKKRKNISGNVLSDFSKCEGSKGWECEQDPRQPLVPLKGKIAKKLKENTKNLRLNLRCDWYNKNYHCLLLNRETSLRQPFVR